MRDLGMDWELYNNNRLYIVSNHGVREELIIICGVLDCHHCSMTGHLTTI